MNILKSNSAVALQTMVRGKKAFNFGKELKKKNNVATAKNTIYILGKLYQVYFFYSNTKVPSIYLENHHIVVILPNKYKKMDVNLILNTLTEKFYDKIAEQEIERAMEKVRLMVGFAPEDFEIKRLKDMAISSCNATKKEITFSPDIVKYDRNTIEYIVLHEFCHLKYKIHAKGFWQMIKKYMPNYEIYKNVYSV